MSLNMSERFEPYNEKSDAAMFIIPNNPKKYKNFSYYISGQSSTPELFKNIAGDAVMIQVWVFGPSERGNWEGKISDNWADHDLPKWLFDMSNPEKNNKSFNNNFPTHIPLSAIKGKKEEDIIAIKVNGVDIKIELNQNNTRYRSHGSFNEVLNKLIEISKK